jgi:hypothetical protein
MKFNHAFLSTGRKRRRLERSKRGHTLPKERPTRFSSPTTASSNYNTCRSSPHIPSIEHEIDHSSPCVSPPEDSLESSFQSMIISGRNSLSIDVDDSFNQASTFPEPFSVTNVIVHRGESRGSGSSSGTHSSFSRSETTDSTPFYVGESFTSLASQSNNKEPNNVGHESEIVMRKKIGTEDKANEFNGWRMSSVEVSTGRPRPISLRMFFSV